MASELDWFPCEPGPLLGTLAGMKAPKKLVYLILILRIYECGGGCPDSIDALSVRVGLNRRIVSDALDELFREGRLMRGEGGIRNPKADVVIADSMVRLKRRKAASSDAANARWQKAKENQQNGDAERNANALQTDAQRQIQEQDSLFSNENRVPASKPKPAKPKAAKPATEPVDDGWPADHLEQFWQAFPPFRRMAKSKVGEKLGRIRRAGSVTWTVLMAGVTRYAMSDPGEYAKAPVAWLNSEGWQGVYKINNGGGNHEANRGIDPKLSFAGLAARIRHGRAARAAPEAAPAGDEPTDRRRDTSSVVELDSGQWRRANA